MDIIHTCQALAAEIGGRCRKKGAQQEGQKHLFCPSHHRNGQVVPRAFKYLIRFTLGVGWEGRIRDARFPIIDDRAGQLSRNATHERRAREVGRDFHAYRGKGEEAKNRKGDDGSLVFRPHVKDAYVQGLFDEMWVTDCSGLVLSEVEVKVKKKQGEILGFTLSCIFMDRELSTPYIMSDKQIRFVERLLGQTWGKVFIYDNPPKEPDGRKVTINCTSASQADAQYSIGFNDGLFDLKEIPVATTATA